MSSSLVLLAAVSISTRVFGGCLSTGLAFRLMVHHFDRPGKRLPVGLGLALRVLSWVFVLGSAFVLFFEPFG